MKYPQFELQAAVEQTHWWHVGKKRILRDLLQTCVPFGKDKMVVDIGCGTGGNIAFLKDQYSCVGIDTSIDAIGFARDRFPEVEFVCGQAPEDLEEAQRQADAFLLMDVLEHIEDDHHLLSKIVNVAKPGAFFYITVPADMLLWSEHDVSLGHYRRYQTRSELENVWRGLPVEVKLLSHYNSRLYPLAKIFRTLSRFKGGTWGEAGTDVSKVPRPLNAIFESVFAGEAKKLLPLMNKADKSGYPFGVSFVALLQKSR